MDRLRKIAQTLASHGQRELASEVAAVSLQIKSSAMDIDRPGPWTTSEQLRKIITDAGSFMQIGRELKQAGIKYTFSTESPMPPIYVVHLNGGKYGILNKKYADEPDFVVGDIAVGKMASMRVSSESDDSYSRSVEAGTQTRPLSEIAREIFQDWKPVNYAARPYLEAMSDLNKITDDYGQDPATQIVAYFLSNATSWRGPKAKEIKAELKKMLK